MEQVLRRSGIPLALYSDRRAVFRPPHSSAREARRPPSSRGRWRSWGVRLIFARSAQAKGRGERMAGTFQDRARFADPCLDLGAVLAFRRTRAVARVAIRLRTVAAHQN